MMRRKLLILAWSAAAAAASAPDAYAAMPVIDVRAIAQMVQQIRTLQDQLQTARDHLSQARQTFASMTGRRGMERLLAGTTRNYLPSDWTQLASALQGLNGGNAALNRQVGNAVATNAILTQNQLATLEPRTRAMVEDERRAVALRQVTTREALANSSARFQSIQQLIDSIPGASDPKGIYDLQARMQAELGMLQNEQTKLQVLQQVSDVEERAQQQREWELAVDGQGRFATRFQPQP
jgi:type IV secretion system protein VirB5